MTSMPLNPFNDALPKVFLVLEIIATLGKQWKSSNLRQRLCIISQSWNTLEASEGHKAQLKLMMLILIVNKNVFTNVLIVIRMVAKI